MELLAEDKGVKTRTHNHHLFFIVIVAAIALTMGLVLGWLTFVHYGDVDVRSKLSQQVTSYTLPSGFYEPYTTLKHEFRIVNDTSSPVRLSHINTSCSCTTAELTRKDMQPNEETLLRMSLTMVNASGKRNAQCVLGDDNGKYWIFRISATSYPVMEFTQGGNHAYVHIGTLNPGEYGSGTVDLYTYADPNGQPPQIEINDAAKTLKAKTQSLGVETLPDGFHKRSERVLIQLPKQTEPGLHKAEITVGCRSGKVAKTATITVIWQVNSVFIVKPEIIVLGILVDSKARERHLDVTVERIDGRRLETIAVHASHPGIMLEGTTRLSHNKIRIAVVVDTASFSGPICGEVLIETGYPVQSRVIIPVVGFK